MKMDSIIIIGLFITMSVFPLMATGEDRNGYYSTINDISHPYPDLKTHPDLLEDRMTIPSISKTGFIENSGQIGNERIQYYTIGGELNIGLSTDRIYYTVRGEDILHTYQVSLLGSRRVEPRGTGSNGPLTSYFIGDREKWVSGARSYGEVTYSNIYPDIDMIFKAVDGKLKYDIVVRPGGEIGDIRLEYKGADLELKEGELMIITPAGSVFEEAPYTYQEDGSHVESRYELIDDTVIFRVGEYDRSMDLVIDPGVYFSSYLGSSDDDTVRDVAVDEDGYVYATGSTKSSDFPTTPGSYKTDHNSGEDVFVVKFNKTGDRLIYSTFIGSNSDDIAYGLDVDSSGHAYVVGETGSSVYPTVNAFKSTFGGQTDGFITKLNSNGSAIVYSSLLGGYGGDGARDIVVDSSGSAILTGFCGYFYSGWWQDQWKFPTTSGAYDRTFNGQWNTYDAFLMKVSSGGSSLDFSTLIGSSSNEYGYSVAIDDDDQYYITGETQSSGFPTTNGAYDRTISGVDIFISKFNSYGSSLLYSTFLGGSGLDRGRGIAVNETGTVFLTGETSSGNYPTTTGAYDTTANGNYDSFVTVLSSDFSSLSYSSFIGGSGIDNGQDIVLGNDGRIYVAGSTQSNNFPVSNDALFGSRQGGGDGFVTIIGSDLSTLDYSTYLGGSSGDAIYGLDVDEDGLIIVGGSTLSSDMITSMDAYDDSKNSMSDGFVTKFYPADFSPSSLVSTSGYFYVDLEWDIPETLFFEKFDIIGYRVYRAFPEGKLEHLVDLGNVTGYNDTINNFVAMEYTYRITALFETIGESMYSNSISGTPLVTPRPIDPVPRSGDMFVNLTWNRIDDHFFFMFDIEYNVYRGLSEEYLNRITDVGTNNWYNDTDIAPEPRIYYYAISYSIRGVGESNRTDIIQGIPNTPPASPDNLSMIVGDLSFDIRWDPPADTGGYPITGYSIFRGFASGDMFLFSGQNATDTGFHDGAIEAGVAYRYMIKAENRLGHSYGSVEIDGLGQTVPSPPEDSSLVEMDGSVIIHWKEPKNTWSIPITGYVVYIYEPSSTRSDTIFIDPESRSYSHQVMNGVVWSCHVTALNIHGESDPTDIMNGSGRGVPGYAISPYALTGDSEVRLFWSGFENDGGSTIRSIKIYMATNPETRSLVAIIPPETTTHSVRGLKNGVNYFFWISATNTNGEGEASNPIQAKPGRIPGRIDSLTVEPLLDSIRLDWLEPVDTGGRDGLEYNLYRGNGRNSLERMITLSFNTRYYIDVNLKSGRNYHYSISLTNNFGEGPLSDPISGIPFGRPSGPVITDHSATSNSIEVHWEPPVSDGGSNITGYIVEYKPLGGSNWDKMETGGTSAIIRSLTKDIEYIVRVTAVSLIAVGETSKEINQIVGTLPEPPASVSLKVEGNDIRVKWTPRPLSAGIVDSYRIYLAVNGGKWDFVDETDSSTSEYMIMDLVAGNDYTVAISSVNRMGEGIFSGNRTIKLIGAPGIVEEMWIESQGPNRIELMWSQPAENGGSDIIRYRIFRGTSRDSITEVATTDNNRHTDEEVLRASVYYYQIVAENTAMRGGRSNILEATTNTYPGQVNGLTEKTASDEVVLKWEPPEFDGGSEIMGYLVYRSKDGGEKRIIAELGPKAVGYRDNTITSGAYRYTVAPLNSMGEGDHAYVDADVPSRIVGPIISFLIAFIIPLLIFLLVSFMPGYLRRRKERKEMEKQKMKEEDERRRAAEELEKNRLTMKRMPPLAPSAAPSLQTGQAASQLPPAIPRVDETSSGEGYIRPTDLKKKKKDKKKVLRADGRSMEDKESEKHLTEIKSGNNEHQKKYSKELKEVLEKESESVFTGEQTMAPPPMADSETTPVQGEVVKAPVPVVDEPENDIKEWKEDELEVPLSEPPEELEETGK